ncbi:type IV pilus assembly protein PilC [Aneurinibacillus soli]|uniref:Type II secretion system protein F n=2 Tax=Aneurinibacillus soli TaxID=1500254 RepID=A0A0U4WDV1_9BACL|nr:type II secretion system F family protein [Aneurinibacillus soli]PYE62424.1 type IV pilus assembly protein PilC [Aneurinibacillus soli]BAU26987.1 Type II secretion system protein F [Aneurinibacillus soli]
MPLFSYEAVGLDGVKTKGKLTAANKLLALAELKQQGLYVSVIREEKQGVLKREITLFRPVKSKDFIVFLRQLSTLIKAGVGIVESIHILAQQSESKRLRQVLLDIEIEIQGGRQLSEACAKHPRIFDELYISMLKAAEASGSMETILDRMAGFYEKSHYTREKLKSAMIYPLTMLGLTVGVTLYLLTNVVPMFVQMFNGLHAELPAITKSVVAVSNSMIETWYMYVLAILGLYIALRLIFRTKRGRYWADYMKLRIPVFGKLLQKGALARLSRTMSTLFASSVPVLQALTIVENVADNRVIGQAIAKSRDSLRAGRPLSEPLKQEKVFPPLVSHMIAIGEETGAMDGMLEKIAEFYEAEVENSVERIKALIEPVMIIVLAVIIGSIVLSIMVPMFEIFNRIDQQ